MQNTMGLTEFMDFITPFIPIIILLIIVQMTLMLIALIHAIRNQRFKTGNLILWVLVIIFVNMLGPILYFIIGRAENTEEENDE